ncbi:MAG: hypothetical protein WA862_12860 [Solirubrobacterales bacterium]
MSGLLAALSLLAGLGTALLGILAAPIAFAAVGALVVYRLGIFGESAPPFPTPSLSLAWLGQLARFVVDFVAWAAPQVPFVAPFLVFVAVTWPLPRESAESLRFQEQASQIILVLLIGYVIEAGAIRWRDRPVNWILSLMTVAILLAGEIYALVDLATDDPDHADIIAGSMAAGVAAILIAAIQGSLQREVEAPGSGDG